MQKSTPKFYNILLLLALLDISLGFSHSIYHDILPCRTECETSLFDAVEESDSSKFFSTILSSILNNAFHFQSNFFINFLDTVSSKHNLFHIKLLNSHPKNAPPSLFC